MIGYAVTCTADSTTEARQDRDGLLRLWEAIERAPKPSVVVISDIGPDPRRGCHMGEVMATTAKALGAVGCVCDAGLRDVAEVEALGGFQDFCPGFVVSHGRAVILDFGVPVTIAGLMIAPGDLLHGDVNGLLTVPEVDTDRGPRGGAGGPGRGARAARVRPPAWADGRDVATKKVRTLKGRRKAQRAARLRAPDRPVHPYFTPTCRLKPGGYRKILHRRARPVKPRQARDDEQIPARLRGDATVVRPPRSP